jgi:endonuclease/exonuclease/phosphatase family metal-dependent hydrolase
MNFLVSLLRALILLVCGGYAILRYLNFRPPQILEENVFNDPGAPTLDADHPIRVLTYNIQYFAGTKYHFFYDGGRDTRAAVEEIHHTLRQIADFILASEADFVFLQEADVGAKRSGYTDQIGLLRARLGAHYGSWVSSYYWRSKFVPHPKILGRVGMKLLVLSRYKLGKAYRHKLASTPGKPLNRDFNIKRAFLTVEVPATGARTLTLINTHLEAFTEGTNVLQVQLQQIKKYLELLNTHGVPWILGGDFNALPPGQYERLWPADRAPHTNRAELRELFESYSGVPTINDATGPLAGRFFTFTQPDNGSRRPCRTLDYLFVSPTLRIASYHVEQETVLSLSDHLPVVAVIESSM